MHLTALSTLASLLPAALLLLVSSATALASRRNYYYERGNPVCKHALADVTTFDLTHDKPAHFGFDIPVDATGPCVLKFEASDEPPIRIVLAESTNRVHLSSNLPDVSHDFVLTENPPKDETLAWFGCTPRRDFKLELLDPENGPILNYGPELGRFVVEHSCQWP